MKRIPNILAGTLALCLVSLFVSPQDTMGKSLTEKSDDSTQKAVQTKSLKKSIQKTPAPLKKRPSLKTKSPAPSTKTDPEKPKTLAPQKKKSPLKLGALFLEDGTVRVTIAATGEGKITAADYAAFKLVVETDEHKQQGRWSLLKVDPRRRLGSKQGKVTFDTRMGLEKRGTVQATLSRGLWKTSLSETLSPQRAVRTVGKRHTKDQSRASTMAEMEKGTTQVRKQAMGTLTARNKTMTLKDANIVPFQKAPEKGITRLGRHLEGGFGEGMLNVLLPRGGDYRSPGERIAVNWQADDRDPGFVSEWIVYLRKDSDPSVDHVLYPDEDSSMLIGTGSALEVELPEDLTEGNDYRIHVVEQVPAEHTGEGRYGSSMAFEIGPLRSFHIPRERSVVFSAPLGGDTFHEGMMFECRWHARPAHLPIPDRVTFRIIPESEEGDVFEREFLNWHLDFDMETNRYSLDTRLSRTRTNPGSYRVEIEHHYDAIDGSGLSGSFSGRSGVFTVQAEPRGDAVSLLEPHPGIGIHPGEPIPFRWEISRDHIEAYGRVDDIRLKCLDTDDETLSDLARGVSVDTGLHRYDLPTPETLPEGEYTAVIQVHFESGFSFRAEGASFEILPPRELLVITYPTGGTFSCGESYPIRWDTIEGADAGFVRIELMKGHRVVETLADMVRFSHERWDWDLEADCSGTVHSGEGYAIRITHVGGDEITDTSDAFTIACPGIRLNRGSPRDGETWPLGGSRQILWTPENMPDDATVRIELRRGFSIYTIARGVPANQDYYEWTVGDVLEGDAPAPSGEEYYIMINQEGCERVFGSSPQFTFE